MAELLSKDEEINALRTGVLENNQLQKLTPGTGGFKETGTYRNEVRFAKIFLQDTGSFWKWEGKPGGFQGSGWVKVPANEARNLYLNRDKYMQVESDKKDNYNTLEVSTNPKGPTGIRYPSNIASDISNDYIIFDFYNYVPPFSGNKPMEMGDLPKNLKLFKEKKGGSTLITNETLKQYNQTAASAEYYNAETAVYPQIMLYMPDDISTTFGAEWEGKSFGNFATGILQSVSAEGNIEKLKKLGGASANQLQKLPAEAAASLITNLAKGVTGDAITSGDVFGGIAGVVRNPNTELMFQKMKLRTFNLSFKLTPYSAKESDSIKRICNIFQRAMLPTYSLEGLEVLNQNKEGKAENRAIEAAFIRIPKVCKVSFMQGDKENEFLPKYKMCAITDVQVNYTPDGNYATFNDGAPVAYELKLSFMETKLVFAEDIVIPDEDIRFTQTLVESGSGESAQDNIVDTTSGGPYMRSSDIKLKENITKIGKSPSGINIYEWNYKSAPDTRYRGVMAHEILNIHPEAVALQPDGYMSVLYGRIDVNMEMVK